MGDECKRFIVAGPIIIIPILLIVGSLLVTIPFSITLTIAVREKNNVVLCDIKRTGYISSISDSRDGVIVTIANNPPHNGELPCSDTHKLPYPENKNISLQDMVTVYEECWCRCYSHNIDTVINNYGFASRCPRHYYWKPPRAENDCDTAIRYMSTIVGFAGVIFVLGLVWFSIAGALITICFICPDSRIDSKDKTYAHVSTLKESSKKTPKRSSKKTNKVQSSV